MFYLDKQLHSFLHQDQDAFDQIMQWKGECFRSQKGRVTQRIRLGNKFYFLKQHFGVGWKEIFKNLMVGKRPVIGARNEWQALQKLQHLNIAAPKIYGFGKRGRNPAKQQSFVLMEALSPVESLEDICHRWPNHPPSFCLKLKLIKEVAHISRSLHAHGINHCDYYICHFLTNLKASPLTLFLIDLHRAQLRTVTPAYWRIKDIAGLYFSSLNLGLTQRDLFRFMKHYRQLALREVLTKDKHFWQKVKWRGDKLYRKHTRPKAQTTDGF